MSARAMHRFWKFLKAHYRAYNLLPDYLSAVKHAGWDVLWAPIMPSIAYWLLWFRPNPPAGWITTIYVVWVVLIAGYFLWRADHVRLIPKIELGKTYVIKTPTNNPNIKKVYAQLLVRCSSEAPLTECRGHLLRVWKWSASDEKWRETECDEPLDLLWSNIDQPLRNVEPGVDQRLDIFCIDNVSKAITIWAAAVQYRAAAVFTSSNPSDIFKFDIRVSAKESPPIYISLRVQAGDDWETPLVERIAE